MRGEEDNGLLFGKKSQSYSFAVLTYTDALLNQDFGCLLSPVSISRICIENSTDHCYPFVRNSRYFLSIVTNQSRLIH